MRRLVFLLAFPLLLLHATSTAANPPQYAWLAEGDQTPTISLFERFPTPSGFMRVEVENGSYGYFLRHLPVREDRTYVLAHDGRRLSSPSAAVIHLDVGTRDLQQCADTAIRLHAEWLWSIGRGQHAAYHFTSGDRVRFAEWVSGERYVIDGSRVERRQGPGRAASYASYRRYLDLIFLYAGTRSLHRDARSVASVELMPGDMFNAPGSPGHAVIVLDMATDGRGRHLMLLGQGFMPAQELHVIKPSDNADVIDDVWFVVPQTDEYLHTPSWRPFAMDQILRFR